MPTLKPMMSARQLTALRSHDHLTANQPLLNTANACLTSISCEPTGQGLLPRGQAMRTLRIQQDWDPASLASKASVSLRQLFQLETGAHSLFPHAESRDQAGRRVATILGANWDQLGKCSTCLHQVE